MVSLGLRGPTKEHEEKPSWMEVYLSDPKSRMRFEEESLIVEVSEQLLLALEYSGRSKAELAEKLGTSRANISQLLDGRRNLTLRTLARLAFHVGMRVRLLFTEIKRPQMEPIEMAAFRYSRSVLRNSRNPEYLGALPGMHDTAEHMVG